MAKTRRKKINKSPSRPYRNAKAFIATGADMITTAACADAPRSCACATKTTSASRRFGPSWSCRKSRRRPGEPATPREPDQQAPGHLRGAPVHWHRAQQGLPDARREARRRGTQARRAHGAGCQGGQARGRPDGAK